MLRFEDTDRERSKREWEEVIIQERVRLLDEVPPYIAFFFKDEIDYSERAVNRFLTPAMRPFLQQSTETMKTVEWSISSIEVTTRALINELALKPREALYEIRPSRVEWRYGKKS